MSDYKKEKVEELKKMRGFIVGILLDVRGDNEYPSDQVIQANASLLQTKFEKYLVSSLQEMEERTREAERERIVKVFEGSYPTTLELFGSSTVERMKDVVYKALSPSEEKECACYCHYPATAIHPSDFRICPHCSPQKEKRGR